MAMSNAERQARYKKNRPTANQGDGDYQLNCWITSQAKFALKRIARHYQMTQRAVLEWILTEVDDEIFQELTDEEAEAYISSPK